MLIYMTIILLILVGSVAVSINSITGNSYLWDSSLLVNFGKYWGHKGMTSGRKWKDGKKALGERFPFASTMLSAFTDAWHGSYLVVLITFSVAGILTGLKMYGVTDAGTIIQMLLLWVITFGFSFNYTHHYVLMNDPIPAWQVFLGFASSIIIGALGLQFGLFDNGWIFFWIFIPVMLYLVIVVLIIIFLYTIKAFRWIKNKFKK